jgi:hypothetical protein
MNWIPLDSLIRYLLKNDFGVIQSVPDTQPQPFNVITN